MRAIVGEILYVDVKASNSDYQSFTGLAAGWYNLVAEATAVYFRPIDGAGVWTYTNGGSMVERGDARGMFIGRGELSVYIPTGGTARLEQIRPIDPYARG